VADSSGYAASYLVSAGIAAFALPFIALSRNQNAPADTLELTEAPAPQPAVKPRNEREGTFTRA
jgi:hypothetical protein